MVMMTLVAIICQFSVCTVVRKAQGLEYLIETKREQDLDLCNCCLYHIPAAWLFWLCFSSSLLFCMFNLQAPSDKVHFSPQIYRVCHLLLCCKKNNHEGCKGKACHSWEISAVLFHSV